MWKPFLLAQGRFCLIKRKIRFDFLMQLSLEFPYILSKVAHEEITSISSGLSEWLFASFTFAYNPIFLLLMTKD